MRLIKSIAGCMLLAAASIVIAQPYPSKPIRILIGFPPGSGGETQVRLVGQKLTEAWGQPIVVDARPGASGNIATEMLVKSPPDGYTLQYFPAALAINPSLFPKVPYDLAKDFTPIALLGTFPLVLVEHPGVPAKSVAELIALAKAKPGSINFASIGPIGESIRPLFAGRADDSCFATDSVSPHDVPEHIGPATSQLQRPSGRN